MAAGFGGASAGWADPVDGVPFVGLEKLPAARDPSVTAIHGVPRAAAPGSDKFREKD